MTDEFKPYKRDFLFGSVLSVVGLSALGLALAKLQQLAGVQTYLWTTAMAFVVPGCIYLNQGYSRWHGQAFEKKWRKKLAGALKEGWVVEGGIRVTQGDLDALLEGPDGERFAIEIKSQRRIRIAKGGLITKAKLIDHKDKTVGRDALVQAARNGAEVSGKAVLWYPGAKVRGTNKDVEGVVVVCGGHKELLKALGVPKKGWF